jgi:hypothetical protein
MTRQQLQIAIRELEAKGYNVVKVSSPTPLLEWCYSLYLEGTLELVSEVYE